MNEDAKESGTPLRIFTAKRILAMDGSEPEAFVTRGEVIVACGPKSILSSAHPEAEHIELEGELVVPGFNDAHCHPSQAAFSRIRIDLSMVSGTSAIRGALEDGARAGGSSAWVIAQGLDERRSAGETIDRRFLDSISLTQPILVVHYTLHRAVANSRALQLLGYQTVKDAPHGGELLTDSAGQLNGWILERAWLDQWLPGAGRESILPRLSLSLRVAALQEVICELHAAGITSFCDAIVTPEEREAYEAALRQGRLTARVSMLIWHSYFDDQLPLEKSSTMLQVSGVKMMLDGALSGGTCLCIDPYSSESDDPRGLQILDDTELYSEIARVHASGMRVAVHANGDRAIEKVLDAFDGLPQAPGRSILNHRIEHCSIVNVDLIERIRKANVTPVLFGPFMHLYGGMISRYYGDDRVAMTSAHRSFLDAGVDVAGSSDYPLAPISPLLGIQSMVTRDTMNKQAVGHNQKITVLEALAVYTTGSAYSTGEAGFKGKIAPGYLADFVALDTDITSIDPQSISKTGVLSTWVGSKCVWSMS